MHLLFVLIIYVTNKMSSVDTNTSRHKCAIVLRGESFRTGGQNSRIKGQPTSVSDQLAAAQTHIQLAELLIAQGYEPHMYLSTYETPYSYQLIEVYKPYLRHANIVKRLYSSQQDMIYTAVSSVPINEYECVLIVRIDIAFKPAFFEAFSITDKITFASVCWYDGRKTRGGFPRINDMYYQFPKSQMQYLQKSQENRYAYGHDFIEILRLPPITYRFMTPFYYDSDSQKDWNPFYRIVNRPECETSHSGTYRFPEDF